MIKKKTGSGHRVDHKAHVSASLGGVSFCGRREGRFWCPDVVRLPHVLPNGVPPDSCLQREAVKSVKTFLSELWEDLVPSWLASGFGLWASHPTPSGLCFSFGPMGFVLIIIPFVSQGNDEGRVQ